MAITLLNTETDKKGNSIQIMKTDTLGLSPIYTFFLRQMADLIDAGFCYPITTWDDNTCSAIYAVDETGKILGHIVYEHKGQTLWITLSAVDSSCRGQGIYSILHTYFEEEGRKLGCFAISSHVHKNNKVRQASCESVGMVPVFYYMGKKL